MPKIQGHVIPGLPPKLPAYVIPESEWSILVAFPRLWETFHSLVLRRPMSPNLFSPENGCLPSFSFINRDVEKADAMEHVVRQGMVQSFITYQKPNNKRIFLSFSSPTWFQKETYMDNIKRLMMVAGVENLFDPDVVQWDKISQGLMRNPDRTLLRVDADMIPPPIHTTSVSVLIFELPPSTRKSGVEPKLYRKGFEPYDQKWYNCTVLEQHTCYPIPADTQYILMIIQKTVFALDMVPETVLLTLLQNSFRLGDFRNAKLFHQKSTSSFSRHLTIHLQRKYLPTSPSAKDIFQDTW
ncbi:hypothetical protein NPIL_554811 [Nephila pilipes]|uniref:Uncharacterized protein n=1 Tax=Nephila pilipes TaxID=299642 RepID=A0A8X6MYV6_NEPPI|nr:hypothetical protein NPIL_554811 [Nephila pilipes]